LPAAPVQGPAGSHTVRNIILAVAGVLFIVVALGIGGAIYVGMKVKEKATSIAARVTSSPSTPARDANNAGDPGHDHSDAAEQALAGLANLLQGKRNTDAEKGDDVPTISKNDPVVPCTAGTMPSQDGARIPLRKGTVVTTAWGIKKGDVELRNAVTDVDGTGFTDTTSRGEYVDDNGRNIKATSDTNTVCSEDLGKSAAFTTTTWSLLPQIVHSLTRLRLSDKTFQEIRAAGHTHLAEEDFTTGDGKRAAPTFDEGDLMWTEKQDVAYPLIVNDQKVTVPAIHLTGIFDSHGKDARPVRERPVHIPTELYVLDDPLDPLVLLLKMTAPQYHDGKYRIEVTSVSFEVPHPVNLVEKQLTEQKRAVTYGIYFDFNKDTIKPESEPVLKQIVQAMTDNPTWKLTVEGHTDNIGGNDYNLDLSKRRAAAVKRALVDQYHIDPERLQTDGFGASRPVETNDTLEGRARNRRVELTRE
jgi:outer membrane protein OmpA-like peptidoglycan-associated protein